MTTESMVLRAPGELDRAEFDVPEITDGALLEVEATAVCGTDLGLYQGKGVMGEYPVVLGHEVTGRIVDGDDATLDRWGVTVGDRVTPEPYVPCMECSDCQRGHYHMCDEGRTYGVTISSDTPPHIWGGYGDHMYLDPNSRVHPVGDDVPARASCLSSVVGNGVRWIVEKGQVRPNDAVAIVGPGAQGLASTIVADEAGADPLVLCGLQVDEPKLELGLELGATHAVTVDGDDAGTAVGVADGDGFDVVVVTAPGEAAMEQAIDLVRPRGRIVAVGLSGHPIDVDADSLVVDEITLLGGRGQAGNVERAMAILERNADAVARINSHRFPVSEAGTAIRRQLPGDEFDPEIVHAVLDPN